MAVRTLGPNGEMELVEIRTRTIGGIGQYYRYNCVSQNIRYGGT